MLNNFLDGNDGTLQFVGSPDPDAAPADAPLVQVCTKALRQNPMHER